VGGFVFGNFLATLRRTIMALLKAGA